MKNDFLALERPIEMNERFDNAQGLMMFAWYVIYRTTTAGDFMSGISLEGTTNIQHNRYVPGKFIQIQPTM